MMLTCKIRSIPLFSQNSFNRELTFSTLVLHASPFRAMVEITILFLFVLRTLTSRDISEQICLVFYLSLDRLYRCVKCMRLGQSLFELVLHNQTCPQLLLLRVALRLLDMIFIFK